MIYFILLENVNKPPKVQEVMATTIHIDDALTIFEYLCKMSGKDTARYID